MGKIMTPEYFVEKWSHSKLSEKSASHEHFIDLCNLLHEKTPADDDPDGSNYTFEKGIHTTSGKHGWADVWKRKYFAWEYKSHHKNLQEAYAQLQQYAPALENPPLLIVSDMREIDIYTNWTNTVTDFIKIQLNDILKYEYRKKLQYVFKSPDKLKPDQTREEITEEIANKFSNLAKNIKNRGYNSYRIARFLNKLIFCMFAEDEHIGLLPPNLFFDLVKIWLEDPINGVIPLKNLFKSMREKGRYRGKNFFGNNKIDWFNGGVFEENDDVIPLYKNEIKIILDACDRKWHDIEPAIFGNLFERSLDSRTIAQLGARYTDETSINRIIYPVIIEPLKTEWNEIKKQLNYLNTNIEFKENFHKQAYAIYKEYLFKIQNFKILDPACGSGNFLNVALKSLKDFEHEVILEAEKYGIPTQQRKVGPQNVIGIDINGYATEIANVSIWICELQWNVKHGLRIDKNPIIKKLENIETRDALVNDDGSEASWPIADVIIGNPPYLGDKKMFSTLGQNYINKLRQLFKGRLPGRTDLVTYWFEKAREQILNEKAKRIGFVSTNSIRGGSNRTVLDRICKDLKIYNAWSDLDWILEGASVRVSIINISKMDDKFIHNILLDNKNVNYINSDLSTHKNVNIDITNVRILFENKNICYQGMIKTGAFDISGDVARKWLLQPNNPNGSHNRDVLKIWYDGYDFMRRPRDKWIIDFGVSMDEQLASLYELPFQYALKNIKPSRQKLASTPRRINSSKHWWIYEWPRPLLREKVRPLSRYLVTTRVAKYRVFIWLYSQIIPDSSLVIIAREDDITFGILQSKFHELWSLKLGTSLGPTPRYTPSTTFETFPFPEGLSPNVPAKKYENDLRSIAIAKAARELNELREQWLNPQNLVKKISEVVNGYPDRIIPINEKADKLLKNRTLTNLYNNKPQWLINAHKKLDDAVANAYGWETDLSDEDILERLFKLNLKRFKDKQYFIK